MFDLRYLNDSITLELDSAKCTGCGMCTEVCPHGVFIIENKKAVIIDCDACIECGACALNCPAGALSVQAGVGCAAAILKGAINGTEPSCGSSGESCCSSGSCC